MPNKSLTPALPYHHQADLHFRSPVSGGPTLEQYATAWLPLYNTACGLPPDTHALAGNLAGIAKSCAATELATLPITPLPELLLKVPEQAAPTVGALAESFLDLLNRIYPLLDGESIARSTIGVLGAPYCNWGTGSVVYSRETNMAVIDFVLPCIKLNAESGIPSVEQVPVLPPVRLPTHQPMFVATRSDSSVSVIQGVATNLAFMLPPPWGPLAAAGLVSLGAIFGSLIGGGDNTLAAFGTMLDAAVQDLEDFIKNLGLGTVENDVTAFFNWLSSNVKSSGNDGGTTPPAIQHWITDILPKLNDTESFARGSLFNDLQQISTEQYLQTNAHIDRANDQAFEVLLLCLTALLCAYKLRVQINAELASLCAPGAGGYCATNEDDSNFQNYLYEWQNSAQNMHTLILGTPPATLDPSVQQALTFDLNKCAATIEATAAAASKDLTTIQQIYGPGQSFSIQAYATQLGWATAIEQLVVHRQLARLLLVSPVQYYDNRGQTCHTQIGPGGVPTTDCENTGSDGYEILDMGNCVVGMAINHWTSGCCDQNSHDNSADVVAAVNAQWPGYFAGVLASVTGEYAGDITAADSWRKAVAALDSQCPIDGPPNSVTISDMTWTAGAPVQSQWEKANLVQYAFSYVNANGPSLRSDWSSPVQIEKRYQPTLRHLPAAKNDARLQVWRQFIFPTPQGDNTVFGLPKIVGTIAASGDWSSYTDTDSALDTIGIPQAVLAAMRVMN